MHKEAIYLKVIINSINDTIIENCKKNKSIDTIDTIDTTTSAVVENTKSIVQEIKPIVQDIVQLEEDIKKIETDVIKVVEEINEEIVIVASDIAKTTAATTALIQDVSGSYYSYCLIS